MPQLDPAAEFERLLRPLIPLLYRQAFRWTTARDQAEDLVQELLLRLYPRLDELARVERLQPWVLRVMYRIFVDQHRRASKSPVRPMHEASARDEHAGENPEDHFPDPSPQPEQLLETALLGERLVAAWSLLGEDQRVVVSMHDIEGYRLEEISGMLEVPVGTLKSRLHRARARLRELLAMEPSCAAVRVSPRGEEI
ncbi:MAG: RNA polymerase sigma factor [Gammaproteobacteria bacterium]